METDRLLLRPWQESDLEALYELAKDPRVGPDCGWNPHKDLSESKFVLQNILMKDETYAIVLKESKKVIGNISLFTGENNELEIGFWLGYPYWGNGYMPEACKALIHYCFTILKLERIWCGHNESNKKSASVQKKCGFKYHHTNPNHYLEQLDQIVVGIVNCLTKEEWA